MNGGGGIGGGWKPGGKILGGGRGIVETEVIGVMTFASEMPVLELWT